MEIEIYCRNYLKARYIYGINTNIYIYIFFLRGWGGGVVILSFFFLNYGKEDTVKAKCILGITGKQDAVKTKCVLGITVSKARWNIRINSEKLAVTVQTNTVVTELFFIIYK